MELQPQSDLSSVQSIHNFYLQRIKLGEHTVNPLGYINLGVILHGPSMLCRLFQFSMTSENGDTLLNPTGDGEGSGRSVWILQLNSCMQGRCHSHVLSFRFMIL